MNSAREKILTASNGSPGERCSIKPLMNSQKIRFSQRRRWTFCAPKEVPLGCEAINLFNR